MIRKAEAKYFRTLLMAGAMALSTAGAFLPVTAAVAQTRTLPDFTDLVDQVGPAVVNIRTVERVAQRGGSGTPGAPGNGEMDEEMQEFFRRFFGQPMPGQPRQSPRPNRPQQEPQEESRPRGVGSGFILSGDGFVMTNAHVVEDASEVLVTLPDKREFKAKIIGADKRTDVAVVKIEATGLPFLKVGDVSKLRVGEWVMAIGSPFGLENTVTAGIVSAKQRDTGDYLPFIQTDVAINPGNSGGPLINMRGEVVGINSQIYSRSGGFMGISFSIPIDEAIRVSEQLRTSGRVSRGRIGVQIDQVSKEVAESIGLGRAQGALVRSVEAGSPGEKAGVEAGDIIIKFDGKAIERPSDLPRLVGNTKPGTRSVLTVFRRGAPRDLNVTVAEIEADKPARSAVEKEEPAPKAAASAAAKSMGLAVGELTEAQKKDLKVRGGVRVEAATDGAARVGLREGDVILAVGNVEVTSVKEFDAAVSKADRTKPVSVLFRRGDWAQYVLIRPAR
ncbi:MAG: DegQ family serine endoprotease [Variovorax sp.]|jgi:serine protease Do|nr:MAG: DegQ family serine endoprotease [Variovorax sp.]